MPLEEVHMLPDRDCVEHVLYHTRTARFRLLGDVFLMQLGCICSRHQEDCTTICKLLENPVLCPVPLMLLKDQQFENYMVKYNKEKVKKEMDKLISSSRLRKQAADVSPESFEIFSYVNINREY